LPISKHIDGENIMLNWQSKWNIIVGIALCLLIPPLIPVFGIALIAGGIYYRHNKERRALAWRAVVTGAVLVVGTALFFLLGLTTHTAVVTTQRSEGQQTDYGIQSTTYEVDGKDVFGITCWRFYEGVIWLSNTSDASNSTIEPGVWGEIFFPGWKYNGVLSNTKSGSGLSYNGFVQGSFSFSGIQYTYPWISLTFNADGTPNWQSGD
jgi:hypothetical protein